MNPYMDFVRSELKELKSKDPDILFECIQDNLKDMKVEIDNELLMETIENELKGAK